MACYKYGLLQVDLLQVSLLQVIFLQVRLLQKCGTAYLSTYERFMCQIYLAFFLVV